MASTDMPSLPADVRFRGAETDLTEGLVRNPHIRVRHADEVSGIEHFECPLESPERGLAIAAGNPALDTLLAPNVLADDLPLKSLNAQQTSRLNTRVRFPSPAPFSPKIPA